jgi:hypothetical protein
VSDASRDPARDSRAAGLPTPPPSLARYGVALVVAIIGTLVIGAAAGLLMLSVQRHVSGPWLWGPGVVALGGLLMAIAATRMARLPVRRALIAVLAVLLVSPAIAQTVRRVVANATVYGPDWRTTSELRNLGVALEARLLDEGGYPAVTTLDALAPLLEGRYLQQVPRVDGWNRPLRYEADGSGTAGRYFIGSAGADGRWHRPRLADYRDLPAPHGDDLVYSEGGFVALPAPR